MKMDRKLVLAVIFIISLLGVIQPVQAQSPTPNSTAAAVQSTAGLPWYVGAIILILVIVGVTLFNERLQKASKKPVISTHCCLPLVEDGDEPFKPEEDEPHPEK